jgi:hypothetical protein
LSLFHYSLGEKFCSVDRYTLQVSAVLGGLRASSNHALFVALPLLELFHLCFFLQNDKKRPKSRELWTAHNSLGDETRRKHYRSLFTFPP